MTTKAECIKMVEAYRVAEFDLLAGKNVMIGNRMFQSENLSEIRKGRAEWERRLKQFTTRRSGPSHVNFL